MTTSDSDAAQPPVVLLHGATASARVWDPVLPMLGARRRVFTPTLAGHHGGPALPTGSGKIVDKIVDATCRQLDEAAIDRAHLVGNSLGGWVALELARRKRAQSVLALSPAGAWRSSRDLRRMLMLFRGAAALTRARKLPELAAHKHVRRILLRLMAERADRMTPQQVTYAFDDIVGCTVLTELLDGASDNGSIKPIADVGCRVRIAWGVNDRMLPFMRYGAPMLAAVPMAEFGFLWGVGHVPMIDDPVLVANTILDFVDSVDA
jgi:pimeloyl-ACP methyl ester carboxylesterase